MPKSVQSRERAAALAGASRFQPLPGASLYNSLATAQYDPTSSSLYNSVPYSGSDAANLYLGVASQYFVRFARPWFHMRTGEFSGYFQNNYKVTSRLTVNLELRYEFFTPPRERDNLLVGYDIANKAIVLPSRSAGSPNVLLEATTAVGGVGEILDYEKEAPSVPPADPQAPAAALERLPPDPQLAARAERATDRPLLPPTAHALRWTAGPQA
jgi:hypothetical protein